MREILFKAKTWEGGRWFFGDLLQFQSNTAIHSYLNGCRVSDDVDPRTVCQYTGLTDRNGVKVFEGDILKFTEQGGVIMDNIEAIEYFKRLKKSFLELMDKGDNVFAKMHYQTSIDAIDAALTALYPTPSGGPLPIEQLEKMTGLPVFLYIFDSENHNCWQIIEKIENGKIFFKGIGRLYVPISELGEKYNLYAHHAARINQNYTNADKIRRMTDEELAELLERCEGEGYQDSSITPVNEYGYHMNMLEWLKQPAEEE